MSSISFDSAEGTVLIGGRERARMGVLIDDLAWTMHSRTLSLTSPEEKSRAKTMWTWGSDDNFAERLGWVCLIGTDALRLVAHIHGQCEIHGWVHPDDGEWFAGLIEQALRDGLLGSDPRGSFYGTWEEVAELARASTTPLVSSYSVTESWPDPYLIQEYRPDLWSPKRPQDEDDDEYIFESWYDLSQEEKNRIADEALPDCAPRWHPAEWGTHWSDIVRGPSPWVAFDAEKAERETQQ